MTDPESEGAQRCGDAIALRREGAWPFRVIGHNLKRFAHLLDNSTTFTRMQTNAKSDFSQNEYQPQEERDETSLLIHRLFMTGGSGFGYSAGGKGEMAIHAGVRHPV